MDFNHIIREEFHVHVWFPLSAMSLAFDLYIVMSKSDAPKNDENCLSLW